MTLHEFIIKALSVPFKEKGRDYTGWDCWGVPYIAYRDILGVELPAYLDEYHDPGNTPASRKELNNLITESKAKWIQVSDYKPMDVVLFNIGGQPVHVGIMIDERKFIHCERKVGTVIEFINSVMWAKRREGVYRLCQA